MRSCVAVDHGLILVCCICGCICLCLTKVLFCGSTTGTLRSSCPPAPLPRSTSVSKCWTSAKVGALFVWRTSSVALEARNRTNPCWLRQVAATGQTTTIVSAKRDSIARTFRETHLNVCCSGLSGRDLSWCSLLAVAQLPARRPRVLCAMPAGQGRSTVRPGGRQVTLTRSLSLTLCTGVASRLRLLLSCPSSL